MTAMIAVDDIGGVAFRTHLGWPSRAPTSEEKTVAAKLQAAVATLATYTDPDDIAAFLTSENAKGDCGDNKRCAGAVWLQRAAGYGNIRLSWRIVANFDGLYAFVATPAALRTFYNKFDDGAYPDLIDPHHENLSW